MWLSRAKTDKKSCLGEWARHRSPHTLLNPQCRAPWLRAPSQQLRDQLMRWTQSPCTPQFCCPCLGQKKGTLGIANLLAPVRCLGGTHGWRGARGCHPPMVGTLSWQLLSMLLSELGQKLSCYCCKQLWTATLGSLRWLDGGSSWALEVHSPFWAGSISS